MHILFYNHAGEVSGAEHVLLTVMESARATGHQVTLCAPPGPLNARALRQGATVVAVPPLTLGYTRNPLVLARYLAGALAPRGELARVVRCLRPEIVYANSMRSAVVAAGALLLVRPRPRFVVHLHDAGGHSLLDRVVSLVTAHEADAIVAISRYVARTVIGTASNVHVLYNAVDPPRYRASAPPAQALRARLCLPAGAPLVAVVGQITPWKGQMEALEACALLRATDPAVHLLVAGTATFVGKHRRYDTVAYREALVARGGKDDLRGAVHLVGEVADVAPVYAAATVLVVPSWAEPFGRVVIEAMAAGCPVVATRAGGIPEIITHAVDGWLVPPRDPTALAAALRLLLDDAALRAPGSGGARHRRDAVRGASLLSRAGAAMGVPPARPYITAQPSTALRTWTGAIIIFR